MPHALLGKLRWKGRIERLRLVGLAVLVGAFWLGQAHVVNAYKYDAGAQPDDAMDDHAEAAVASSLAEDDARLTALVGTALSVRSIRDTESRLARRRPQSPTHVSPAIVGGLAVRRAASRSSAEPDGSADSH